MKSNPIDSLARRLNAEWPSIANARSHARTEKQRIADLLEATTGQVALCNGSDMSMVVFGSLARDEFTNGSDVDWTLLVDGQADPGHRDVAHQIGRRLLDNDVKAPSGGGAFGNLAFSHELIHRVGGDADSNRNMTHRILLLLESAPIANPVAYDRVVRGVLERYFLDDIFLKDRDAKKPVPRFLLNDIVRFWRTMCVDFAQKDWDQAGRKWAIRNIKLRMSRKLLFVAGMLMVSSVPRDRELADRFQGMPVEARKLMLMDHFVPYVGRTPLEILAEELESASNTTAKRIFDAYEGFLEVLSDGSKREALQDLTPANAYGDATFDEARAISHDFQSGLTAFFFDECQPLREFIRDYGVF